jgi:hypothetical protein
MVVSSARLGTKNDCVGAGQQQFARQGNKNGKAIPVTRRGGP